MSSTGVDLVPSMPSEDHCRPAGTGGEFAPAFVEEGVFGDKPFFRSGNLERGNATRQLAVGTFSTRSITSVSTGSVRRSSLNPN
jgi:hypothetical protein